VGFIESLQSKVESETSSLGRLNKKENINYQHYNILSASEVKDETSTSSAYVSLVFYHILRSRKKYLSKNNSRFFFQKGIVLSGFVPKYPWAFRG
jgi:hypothetical protein